MELDERYIAGFFDGEGCVHLSYCLDKKGRHIFSTRVNIAQGNLEILEQIQRQYGGYIYEDKRKRELNERPMWQWHIASRQARLFLEAIYPYLVLKKEQVTLAIEFQKMCSEHKGSTKLTVDEILHRQTLVAQVKDLKR